jgi:hypothetical protein
MPAASLLLFVFDWSSEHLRAGCMPTLHSRSLAESMLKAGRGVFATPAWHPSRDLPLGVEPSMGPHLLGSILMVWGLRAGM